MIKFKGSTPFRYIYGVLIAALLWTSCGSKSGKMNEASTSKTDTVLIVEHEHVQGDHKANVLLNHGQKWSANPETKEGIKIMKDLVSVKDKELSIGDCDNLKSSLETEFNNILSRCTMKGEAHEQLHNFLIPMQGMIQALGTGDSCSAKVQHLGTYLNGFENYFQ